MRNYVAPKQVPVAEEKTCACHRTSDDELSCRWWEITIFVVLLILAILVAMALMSWWTEGGSLHQAFLDLFRSKHPRTW